MKEISTIKAGDLLGVGRNATKIAALLKKNGVKPLAEVPFARGFVRTYDKDQIVALAAKLNPQPVVPASQKQAPLFEDAAIEALLKKIEGQSAYICRMGERVVKLETTNAELEATIRTLVITNNRILKAMGSEEVKFITPERRVAT